MIPAINGATVDTTVAINDNYQGGNLAVVAPINGMPGGNAYLDWSNNGTDWYVFAQYTGGVAVVAYVPPGRVRLRLVSPTGATTLAVIHYPRTALV